MLNYTRCYSSTIIFISELFILTRSLLKPLHFVSVKALKNFKDSFEDIADNCKKLVHIFILKCSKVEWVVKVVLVIY